jgi:hypothetical protein
VWVAGKQGGGKEQEIRRSAQVGVGELLGCLGKAYEEPESCEER